MYGPYLALATAVCWTASSVAFENASRRVGSVPVNIIRLLVAFLLLMGFNAIRLGEVFPSATSHQWTYLLASGVLGFFVGDLPLFRAFVVLGARLTTLLMCLAPPIAAVTEWIWLGTPVTLFQACGMLVTLGAVVWVVYEKPAEKPQETTGGEAAIMESEARLASPSTTVIEAPAALRATHITAGGVLLGITAALGQGVGLVCTKVAMASTPQIDPFAATQIRLIAGIATFAGLVLVAGRINDCLRATRNRQAMLLLLIGAIAGPFLGVSMLNRAVELIPSGVAQTITSLVPILIIPVSIWVQKENVGWKAIVGALFAVAGVAMLMM